MLDINNLQASVEGKAILKGLDLHVKAGEVHAIMGPNGSGKSTLAQVMAGREAFSVDGGSVTWDGQDLLAMPIEERAPRRPLPGLPVPGRDPRRIERLLPQGGGQCCAQASRPAGVRRDGFPDPREGRDEGRRHEGGVPLPLGERRLLGRREEAQRGAADGAARAAPGDPRRDRLGPRHRRPQGGGRRRQPPALAGSRADRHHPLPAPARLHRPRPGARAVARPHRALGRSRTRARAGRKGLRLDR